MLILIIHDLYIYQNSNSNKISCDFSGKPTNVGILILLNHTETIKMIEILSNQAFMLFLFKLMKNQKGNKNRTTLLGA